MKALQKVGNVMLRSGKNLRLISRDGRNPGLTTLTTVCTTKMLFYTKNVLRWVGKKKSTASYSSLVGRKKSIFYGYLNRLQQLIYLSGILQVPSQDLRVAQIKFQEPYLKGSECDLIVISIMKLVIKYAYYTTYEKGK